MGVAREGCMGVGWGMIGFSTYIFVIVFCSSYTYHVYNSMKTF